MFYRSCRSQCDIPDILWGWRWWGVPWGIPGWFLLPVWMTLVRVSKGLCVCKKNPMDSHSPVWNFRWIRTTRMKIVMKLSLVTEFIDCNCMDIINCTRNLIHLTKTSYRMSGDWESSHVIFFFLLISKRLSPNHSSSYAY